MSTIKQQLLIVGHGYFGGHLGQILDRDTFDLFATTRRIENFERLESQQITPILFDVADASAGKFEQAFDAVVYCVGFDRSASLDKRTVYVDGLRNFLSKLSHAPGQLIYVSSTGVYGQSDGEWVDEDSVAAPNRESGQICLDAEAVLREFEIESQKLILRFAGIYGPDRVPNLRSLSSPTLTVPSNSFLNLIHVSDAAKIVRSILCDDLTKLQSELFLISDGKPVERRDFYRHCVELLGIELPEFIEPSAEELAISRFGSSKRITNQRILNETGYQFEFPSYREGLSQILSQHKCD